MVVRMHLGKCILRTTVRVAGTCGVVSWVCSGGGLWDGVVDGMLCECLWQGAVSH